MEKIVSLIKFIICFVERVDSIRKGTIITIVAWKGISIEVEDGIIEKIIEINNEGIQKEGI